MEEERAALEQLSDLEAERRLELATSGYAPNPNPNPNPDPNLNLPPKHGRSRGAPLTPKEAPARARRTTRDLPAAPLVLPPAAAAAAPSRVGSAQSKSSSKGR